MSIRFRLAVWVSVLLLAASAFLGILLLYDPLRKLLKKLMRMDAQ